MKNLNLINPERRLGGHDFCGVNHANQTEVQTDNLSVSGRSEVSMTLDEQPGNHPVITPLSPRNHPLLPKQKSGKSLIRIGKNVAESHVRKYAGASRVWKYAAMVVLMVTLGVGQMWANSIKWYGNVFFRAPDNWDLTTNSHVQIGLAQGTSTSSDVYVYFAAEMTRVGSTRLYYTYLNVDHSSWGAKEYIVFTANSSAWNSNSITLSSCGGYVTPIDWSVSNSEVPYLFTPTTESNGASLSGHYNDSGSEYNDRWYDLLDKAQTINLYTNGSSSNTGGSVNIAGTYMSAADRTTTSGSATSSSSSVNYTTLIGSTVTLTATPATGYQFDGWYTEGTGGSLVSSNNPYSYTCTGEKTIYARFSEKTYNLTFANSDGHGTVSVGGSQVAAAGSSGSADVNHFTNKTLVATPNTGYQFSAWTVSGTNSSAVTIGSTSTASTTIKATNTDATVTASFTPQTYSITLDKGDGDSDGSATITYLATCWASHTEPTKDGWSVEGYYTNDPTPVKIMDAGGNLLANKEGYTNSSSQWIRTSDATLVTHWKQTYSVTYNANYPANATSTGGSVPTDANEYGGGASTTVTVLGNTGPLTAGGYTFDGWQTAPAGGTHFTAGGTFTISANTILYAKWVDVKTAVTLSANPANSGTFTIEDEGATATEAGLATSPSITAVPATGFYLNTAATIWSSDSKITIDDDDAATTAISADGTGGASTLTAAFSEKYVLRGSTNANDNIAAGMAGWSATDNSSYSSVSYAEGVFTIVANLTEQGTAYKFRVFEITGPNTGNWHGCTAADQWMGSNDPWTLNGESGGYDVHFTTTVAGNYTFVMDVTGTHPSVKVVFPVEPTYGVSIQASNIPGANATPHGTVSLKPVTTTAISATIPAGFRFDSWQVDAAHRDYIHFGSSTSSSTTVTADAGGAGAVITATYNQNGFIYFDDSNSDWGKGGDANVYVYFFSADAWYKDESGGKGPGMVPSVNSQYVGKMTRIGYSNIYYFDYSDKGFTPTGYVGFTKGNCYNYNKVQNTSAAWRGDFNKDCYPMYVASSSYTETNSTGYHNTGYWKKYNTTNSGVWLHGTWDTNNNGDNVEYDDDDAIEFIATEPNSNVFKAEVTLSNRDYWFYLKRTCINEYLKNSGAITTSVKNWEFTSSAGSNCKITAPAPGKYVFTLVMNDDHIRLNVDFPLQVNDYRLIHKGGYVRSTDVANHAHPSQHVSHLTEASTTVRDTISFFVLKGHEGTLQLQKCTDASANGGRGTWADSTLTINLSGIEETGIYNFEIVQTTDESSGRTVRINKLNDGGEGYKYTGNLYIRTNAAKGGWDDYLYTPDNKLIYSEYAKNNSGYDFYHCHWIEGGTNVKFCIANDYSHCITDSLTGDTWIGSSDYDSNETLPAKANVRFMYNSSNNTISRAYINGAGKNANDRFLVLTGDAKAFNNDEDGTAITANAGKKLAANELEFDDQNNWVYQVELKAQSDAKIKVSAKYNTKTNYFIGSSEAGVNLISSTDSETKYSLRVVYDFKTNHLVTAWLPPTTDIRDQLSITADMMLIRHGQNAAQELTFDGGSIKNIHTMIGAMEFRKDSIVGHVGSFTNETDENKTYRYMMYYISFPFDVAVQDIYGCGQFNREWYLQYYDGADRADKGFFRGDGTTTFWKFMSLTDTLKAGTGYSLLLDNDYFNTAGENVWTNNPDKVYLYFPSATILHADSVISSTTKTLQIPAHECRHDRTFLTESGREVNHKFTDSHWNMMGVPLFQNYNASIASFAPGTPVDSTVALAEGKGYFYDWSPVNNTFTIHAADDYQFKSMHGYMVQFYGSVLFTGSAIHTKPSPVVARRTPQNREDYTLELQLLRNNNRISRTYIELREEACDTFALNEDVYMMYTSLPADLYTYAGNYDVSANVLSIDNHVVPVGVEVHQAGEYTFAMPDNFSGSAVLVDTEANTRTNLAISDYTVTLPKGVCDGRFFIELDINKMPTSIDVIGTGGSLKDGKAHKFIENGAMYILRDGVVYDARGNKVK